MKCSVILVIIGAMGIVGKSLKNLETILGQHSIHSLQKTVVLGTSYTSQGNCYILRLEA
jgi:hypothetical protein